MLLNLPCQAADTNTAKPIDWRKMMTIAEVQAGRRRQTPAAAVLRRDHQARHVLHPRRPPRSGSRDRGRPLRTRTGKVQMPWVYYSNLQHNGAPFPNSIDRHVSYPAFHHSLMIRTSSVTATYTKNPQVLRTWRFELADWNIAHSTPVRLALRQPSLQHL
jgi:hypothetical protein